MRSSAACVERYARAGKDVRFAPGDVPIAAAAPDGVLAPRREPHRQRARLRRAAGRSDDHAARTATSCSTSPTAARASRRQDVERLKQPFTRASAARTNAAGVAGAGLGLAIVDRIARLHGGTFDLLPRDGGGTVARVTLPVPI